MIKITPILFIALFGLQEVCATYQAPTPLGDKCFSISTDGQRIEKSSFFHKNNHIIVKNLVLTDEDLIQPTITLKYPVEFNIPTVWNFNQPLEKTKPQPLFDKEYFNIETPSSSGLYSINFKELSDEENLLLIDQFNEEPHPPLISFGDEFIKLTITRDVRKPKPAARWVMSAAQWTWKKVNLAYQQVQSNSKPEEIKHLASSATPPQNKVRKKIGFTEFYAYCSKGILKEIK